MATADLTFSTTDFFYNNVNAPIKFDVSKCTYTNDNLTDYISDELNKQFKLNAIAAKNTDKIIEKECVGARRATKREILDTASHKYLAIQLSETHAWSTTHTDEGCKCLRYSNSDDTKITATNASDYANNNNNKKMSQVFFCMDSISKTIDEKQIPGISEVTVPQDLVDSTFNYYKAACANKDKSTKLLGMQETNNTDLKYDDTKEFYIREYINRINLGIGIIATCGFILYSFNSAV
jgi:hypothetical protein